VNGRVKIKQAKARELEQRKFKVIFNDFNWHPGNRM